MSAIFRRFLCCSLFFLAACSNQEKEGGVGHIHKTWIFESVPNQYVTTTAAQWGEMASELRYMFLDLKKDGSFTGLFETFMSGEWILHDETLTLIDKERGAFNVTIKLLNKDRLFFVDNQTDLVFAFRGFDNSFHLPDSINPFSFETNRWRIKPDHRESDEEITARLKAHFKFWECYLDWGIKTNQPFVLLTCLPTPFHIYSVGFGLRALKDQFPDWKNCFFDMTDVRRAHERLRYLMFYNKIRWPEEGNNIELLKAGFHQLQEFLDIDPNTYMKTGSAKATSAK